MKIKLVGAKEILKQKPGTIFSEYWKNDTKSCIDMIKEFKEDPKSYHTFEDMHIYNGPFAATTLGIDYCGDALGDSIDFVSFYDFNVVGDASPTTTLYVIYEEGVLPDYLYVSGSGCTMDIDSLVEADEFIKIDSNRIKNIYNDYTKNTQSTYTIPQWMWDTLNDTNLTDEEKLIINTNIELEFSV